MTTTTTTMTMMMVSQTATQRQGLECAEMGDGVPEVYEARP
jgi:hypothetical protein